MCLAVPLKLVEVNGDTAVAERDGVKRKIGVGFIENPAVGDYVIVHAGFAIEKIAAHQAKENMDAFRELQEALASL